MRDIPTMVSEEQLPRVPVTPYHPHNSANLPRYLPHSTLHLLLRGDGLGSVYTLYSNGDNFPPYLIPFEQRNVTDNELPHCTIDSYSLYQRIKKIIICNGTFLP